MVDTHAMAFEPGEQCPMASRKRRHFPESFKRQAVERVRTSGLPIRRVAEELGVHETVLRRWMARFAEPGTGPAAENARLKRELQRAQMEREIPKKPRSSSGGPAGDLPVRR